MCGICGVFGHDDAAFYTYLMIHAQQHRGQEGAGIAILNNEFVLHKGLGLVSEAFGHGGFFKQHRGTVTIGHNRYSTSGSSRSGSAEERRKSRNNLQPFSRNGVSVAFNGNIANYRSLRRNMEARGACFRTDVDTEVILNSLTPQRGMSLEDRVLEFSRAAVGAYSMIVMERIKGESSLLLVRDPSGNRPLVIGELEGRYPVAASESRAFQNIGAEYAREVEPGEMVRIDENGINNSGWIDQQARRAYCIFELVYFTMPDSRYVFGQSSGRFKEAIGGQLAIEQPADADIVVGIPDSATSAAKGYSRQSGIPEERGLIKSAYAGGRTFIQPDQFTRERGVKLKFSVDGDVVEGRSVALVDDSIVRATTTPHVIGLLRNAGAKEIHMRVSSPPIKHPCPLGVDMPDPTRFVAHRRSVEEICGFIGADSLGYLSMEGMLSKGTHCPEDYCTGCFSGIYSPGAADALETRMQRISTR